MHKKANQAKTNQQNKNKRTLKNKGNNFLRKKLLRGAKLVILRFLKKKLNCPDNFMYYTTELCCLNFAIIKLLLPIYHYSHDAVA